MTSAVFFSTTGAGALFLALDRFSSTTSGDKSSSVAASGATKTGEPSSAAYADAKQAAPTAISSNKSAIVRLMELLYPFHCRRNAGPNLPSASPAGTYRTHSVRSFQDTHSAARLPQT